MSSLPAIATLALPFLLGLCVVGQGGFNRQVASQWGLAQAVFLNNLGFLALGTALFVSERFAGNWMPEVMRSKGGWAAFRLWFLLPSFLGFCIVVGLPFAIGKIGAFKVFLGVIAAQLIGGLAWDAYVERIPVSPTKILGGLLALAGAVLVLFKK